MDGADDDSYVKAKLERGAECDRLLVPPELCDAINRAVQAVSCPMWGVS